MAVVLRELSCNFVKANIAIDRLPVADGVHALVNSLVVVMLEH